MNTETYNSPDKKQEKDVAGKSTEKELDGMFPTLGLRKDSSVQPKVMISEFSNNSNENSVHADRVVIEPDPSITSNLMYGEVLKIELDNRKITKEVAIILFYFSIGLSLIIIALFHGCGRFKELYKNGNLILSTTGGFTLLCCLFMLSVAGLSFFPRINRDLFAHLKWVFWTVAMVTGIYLMIQVFLFLCCQGIKSTVVAFFALLELFIITVSLSISHMSFRKNAFIFSVSISFLFTMLCVQSANSLISGVEFSLSEMIDMVLLSTLYSLYLNLDFLFITCYHYKDYTQGEGIRVFGDFWVDLLFRFWQDLYRTVINKFRIFV